MGALSLSLPVSSAIFETSSSAQLPQGHGKPCYPHSAQIKAIFRFLGVGPLGPAWKWLRDWALAPEELFRMIRPYRGKRPEIAATAYIDPAAVLIGDVVV